MNIIQINRSGQSLNVMYDAQGSNKIGTILNNEVYTSIPTDVNGSPYPIAFYGVATKIMFRNQDGGISVGYLQHSDTGDAEDNAWTELQESYHLYGFYGQYDGQYLYRFNIRGTGTKIYNSSAQLITTLYATDNDYVATNTGRAGDTVTDLMRIVKYRKKNVWVTPTGGAYAAVGYEQGSCQGQYLLKVL